MLSKIERERKAKIDRNRIERIKLTRVKEKEWFQEKIRGHKTCKHKQRKVMDNDDGPRVELKTKLHYLTKEVDELKENMDQGRLNAKCFDMIQVESNKNHEIETMKASLKAEIRRQFAKLIAVSQNKIDTHTKNRVEANRRKMDQIINDRELNLQRRKHRINNFVQQEVETGKYKHGHNYQALLSDIQCIMGTINKSKGLVLKPQKQKQFSYTISKHDVDKPEINQNVVCTQTFPGKRIKKSNFVTKNSENKRLRTIRSRIRKLRQCPRAKCVEKTKKYIENKVPIVLHNSTQTKPENTLHTKPRIMNSPAQTNRVQRVTRGTIFELNKYESTDIQQNIKDNESLSSITLNAMYLSLGTKQNMVRVLPFRKAASQRTSFVVTEKEIESVVSDKCSEQLKKLSPVISEKELEMCCSNKSLNESEKSIVENVVNAAPSVCSTNQLESLEKRLESLLTALNSKETSTITSQELPSPSVSVKDLKVPSKNEPFSKDVDSSFLALLETNSQIPVNDSSMVELCTSKSGVLATEDASILNEEHDMKTEKVKASNSTSFDLSSNSSFEIPSSLFQTTTSIVQTGNKKKPNSIDKECLREKRKRMKAYDLKNRQKFMSPSFLGSTISSFTLNSSKSK